MQVPCFVIEADVSITAGREALVTEACNPYSTLLGDTVGTTNQAAPRVRRRQKMIALLFLMKVRVRVRVRGNFRSVLRLG